ncbi:MAG TPA: hypothetical protein VJ728_08675 [Candidatus Binataceae bacterium]|nr:hypothetical protein [Candidatus Binataceae bacterium]
MPPNRRIALVGATGNVGSQIAELIVQRNFSYSEFKLFARDSCGRMVDAGERSFPVDLFNGPDDLSAFDIAFLAVSREIAVNIIEAQPGPILIDLSSATASPQKEVAMVAPGLTPRDQVAQSSRRQLFAVPHPVAQLIATILQVLGNDGFAAASIMLSASASGHESVGQLFQQSADLLNARLDLDDEPQVAFNVFAAPRAHELAMTLAEQVRVLGARSNSLLLDIVRIPAFHGCAVNLFLPAHEAGAKWPELLRSAPGLIVVANDDATGFVDAVGQEGAITRISMENSGAAIWCVFDAARLAALTALWIAETLSQSPVSE